MNKIFVAFSIIAAMLLALTACSGKGAEETTAEKTAPLSTSSVIAEPENGAESSTEAELVPENSAVPVYIRIGDTVLTVLPSGNSSADALIALLERGDIALDMRDNGGFEKIAELERSLPTNNIPLAAGPGDLILYNGNTEHRRGDSALAARRRGCKHHVFAEKITVRSGNCRAIPLHRDGYTRDAYDTARYFYAMGISGRSHHIGETT